MIKIKYYYISEGKDQTSIGTVSEAVLIAMFSNPNIVIVEVKTDIS